jgi:hypothetical protein
MTGNNIIHKTNITAKHNKRLLTIGGSFILAEIVLVEPAAFAVRPGRFRPLYRRNL